MIRTTYDSDERYPRSVQVFSKDTQKSKLHPTQKPVALMEYLVKTYTNVGDIVLDNCMGSGTTGVACMNTNRNFIGIEMDEKYFAIAQQRINEAQIKEKQLETN
jgi:site-specific DNA-methyltransferase (adenine-specific)